mmetsp:Transcript_56524/g.64792  ORF Transcript_56524/g.64792 Transcript_56524/m.64792 type:complete len:98 (-) Transcript_56524:66-359(-)
MQEGLKEIFDPIIKGCNLNLEEIMSNQEKLSATLTKITTELEEIQRMNYAEKDKQLYEYLDKLASHKKRLATINSKMEKLQTKVDKIEKKFLKLPAQ